MAVLTLALATGLGACGGSGGGGAAVPVTDPLALVSGNYWAQSLGGASSTVPLTLKTTFGLTPADGMGLIQLGGTMNRDGTLTGLPMVTAPYSVDAGRGWHLYDPLSPAMELYRGGVDTSGDLIIAGDIASSEPSMMTFIREGGTLDSDDDLTGTWHFAMFSRSPGDTVGIVGRMSFDGSGNLSVQAEWVNEGGAIAAGPPAPLAYAYAVSPGGVISVNFGGSVVSGRMTPNGELIVLNGSVIAGDVPAYFVLTPVSAVSSPSRLSGAYFLVAVADGGQYASFAGTLVADGVGELTFTVDVNLEGSFPLTELSAPAAPYRVTSEGTLFYEGSSTLQGAISPTGDLLFLGGPIAPVSVKPYLFLGMRK